MWRRRAGSEPVRLRWRRSRQRSALGPGAQTRPAKTPQGRQLSRARQFVRLPQSHASVLLRLVGPRRQTGISALTPRIKMPIAQLRPRPQAVGAFPRYYLKLVRESGWFHRFGSEGTRIRDSSLERVPLGMTARFCKISFNLFLAR